MDVLKGREEGNNLPPSVRVQPHTCAASTHNLVPVVNGEQLKQQ